MTITPKAVLLDVGGVLRNTTVPLAEATQEAFRQVLHIRVSYRPTELYQFRALGRFIHTVDALQALYAFHREGASLGMVLQQISPHDYAVQLMAKYPMHERKLQRMIDEYDRARERSEAEVTEIPGARQALRLLQGRGVALAIYTRTRRAFVERWLEKQRLKPFFPIVIAKEDVFGSSRSASDHFDPLGEYKAVGLKKAMRRLGLLPRPEQVAYVGDTPSDIHGAKAAGCRAIAVLTGRGTEAILRAAQPDELYPDLLTYVHSFARHRS